jgi:DNA polymerase III epsilon subunit-like protein
LTALVVDVEATGLDPICNEIIELAMVPFTYARDGRIFSIGEPFNGLREPREPIPPDITRITGITQAMVADKRIDPAEVSRFIHTADLIIAHNAAFDRRFLERFCPGFENKPWGCSMAQIDWKQGGFEGTRLGYLVAGAGLFYDRHRAINDCYAAIEMLATTLPRGGARALPICWNARERQRGASGLFRLPTNSKMHCGPEATNGMGRATDRRGLGTLTCSLNKRTRKSISFEQTFTVTM